MASTYDIDRQRRCTAGQYITVTPPVNGEWSLVNPHSIESGTTYAYEESKMGPVTEADGHPIEVVAAKVQFLLASAPQMVAYLATAQHKPREQAVSELGQHLRNPADEVTLRSAHRLLCRVIAEDDLDSKSALKEIIAPLQQIKAKTQSLRAELSASVGTWDPQYYIIVPPSDEQVAVFEAVVAKAKDSSAPSVQTFRNAPCMPGMWVIRDGKRVEVHGFDPHTIVQNECMRTLSPSAQRGRAAEFTARANDDLRIAQSDINYQTDKISHTIHPWIGNFIGSALHSGTSITGLGVPTVLDQGGVSVDCLRRMLPHLTFGVGSDTVDAPSVQSQGNLWDSIVKRYGHGNTPGSHRQGMRLKSLRSSAVSAGHTLSAALWVSSIIVHALDDGELNFATTKRVTGPSGGQKIMNSVQKRWELQTAVSVMLRVCLQNARAEEKHQLGRLCDVLRIDEFALGLDPANGGESSKALFDAIDKAYKLAKPTRAQSGGGGELTPSA